MDYISEVAALEIGVKKQLWTRFAVSGGFALAVVGAGPALSQQPDQGAPADLPSVFTSNDGIVPADESELSSRGTGTAIVRTLDGRAQFIGEPIHAVTRFGVTAPEALADPQAAADAALARANGRLPRVSGGRAHPLGKIAPSA